MKLVTFENLKEGQSGQNIANKGSMEWREPGKISSGQSGPPIGQIITHTTSFISF